MDLNIIMEEYLDGPEVDVDLVLSNGAVKYGAVTDNWPTVEPYFNETGSNCPSVLPRGQQMELLDLGIKAVQCMGFQMGVFHVELKYTSRGARLIEVNARMGGGAPPAPRVDLATCDHCAPAHGGLPCARTGCIVALGGGVAGKRGRVQAPCATPTCSCGAWTSWSSTSRAAAASRASRPSRKSPSRSLRS